MVTEDLKSWERLLHYRNVLGAQDDVEDGKDGAGIQGEIARDFLDKGSEDLECDLHIARRKGKTVSFASARDRDDRIPGLSYPILPLQTSFAVLFSRNSPTFCNLLRRVLA